MNMIKFLIGVTKISKNSNLYKCESITKLTIQYDPTTSSRNKKPIIETNSLPSSITDLSIINISNEPLINIPIPINTKKLLLKTNEICSYDDQRILIKNTIPNSITSLSLNFINKTVGSFPSSLTHFQLLINNFDLLSRIPNEEEIQPMITILPKSLIYLDLPIYCKFLNLKINSNIILNFKDI
ncbi:hypothetical protein ACTFIW_007300 [Dictyostelium discoideum]